MRIAWAWAAVLLVAPGFARADVPPLTLSVAPEWGLRRFVLSDPGGSDKKYAASGILTLGARADVFPFVWRSAALGVSGSFAQAVGLTSIDQDTKTEVATSYYRYDLGIRYRLARAAHSLTFGLGYERSLFDFDFAPMPFRPVPRGDYSLMAATEDVALVFGRFSISGGIGLLVPLSIGPLGERMPDFLGLGARANVSLSVRLSRSVSAFVGGRYSMMRFRVAALPARDDGEGRAFDQYLFASAGAAFAF